MGVGAVTVVDTLLLIVVLLVGVGAVVDFGSSTLGGGFGTIESIKKVNSVLKRSNVLTVGAALIGALVLVGAGFALGPVFTVT